MLTDIFMPDGYDIELIRGLRSPPPPLTNDRYERRLRNGVPLPEIASDFWR